MFFIFLKDTAKANIKIVTSYDPTKPAKHVIYLDKNNLSGYGISKSLPKGGFKWLDPAKFKYNDNSSRGCVLEHDLEYPKEVHELHNDYPLPQDKLEIRREMLSDYQIQIADYDNIYVGNVKKLALNVFSKEKCMLHYKNLQLYLRRRLKIMY